MKKIIYTLQNHLVTPGKTTLFSHDLVNPLIDSQQKKVMSDFIFNSVEKIINAKTQLD